MNKYILLSFLLVTPICSHTGPDEFPVGPESRFMAEDSDSPMRSKSPVRVEGTGENTGYPTNLVNRQWSSSDVLSLSCVGCLCVPVLCVVAANELCISPAWNVAKRLCSAKEHKD